MFDSGMSRSDRQRLIGLARLAVKNFNAGDWQALGVYTDSLGIITGHDRLLRSLSFGDDDYSGNAHAVLFKIAESGFGKLAEIEHYITEQYGRPDAVDFTPPVNISTAPGKGRKLVVSPSAFDVPETDTEKDLIAVMSPFAPQFEEVFQTISWAGNLEGYRALRAKDIWQSSTVIQDVFSLIFRAHIVVCDFTGKNPNVFYEAGIAHTLGKHVVPITQSAGDVPFDLQHHRYVLYLNNKEGRGDLSASLQSRFGALKNRDV